MISLVARKTALSGLRDLRFVLLAGLIVLLAGIGGMVSGSDFSRRMAEHQSARLESGRTKSIKQVLIHLPPPVLGFTAEGGLRDLPSSLLIEPGLVDDRGGTSLQHTFILHSNYLDWIFVFGVLGSLLVIVLSFDSVNGEKAAGTMRLIFSASTRKLLFLAGKLVGIVTTISIPVIIGMVLSILAYFALSGTSIDLASSLVIAMAAALVLSFLFLWSAVGILMSTITHRPLLSLMILIGLWIVSVMVIPSTASVVASIDVDVPTTKAVTDEIREVKSRMTTGITREVSKEIMEIVWGDLSKEEKLEQIRQLERRVSSEQEEMIATGRNEIMRIKERRNRLRTARAERAHLLAMISPKCTLDESMQRLAHSGWRRYSAFLDQGKSYMGKFADYVHTIRDCYKEQATYRTRAIARYGDYEISVMADRDFGNVEIDHAGFPVFQYREPGKADRWLAGLKAIALMTVAGLISFLASCWRFLSYDFR